MSQPLTWSQRDVFFKTRPESEDLLATFDRDIIQLMSGQTQLLKVNRTYLHQLTDRFNANAAALQIDQILNASRIENQSSDFGFRIALILETGIWPSLEDWHLYYKLRNFAGDFDDIRTRPGHVFGAEELGDFKTYLSLFLRNGWGGLVAGSKECATITFNHDGVVCVFEHPGSKNLDSALNAIKWDVEIFD